jgi:hypothetical protein
LIGSTFLERQKLLDNLFVTNSYDDFIDQVGPSAYRAKNFVKGLNTIWNNIVKTQMYEGFVLKRPDGILENGFREANNTGWMVKIRKPTKNYRY